MKLRPRCRVCPLAVVIVMLVVAGCGGSEETNSTSHEELTEFLEENPEFADPGTQSETAPLGLE